MTLIGNAQLFRWEQTADGLEWTLTRGPGTWAGRVRTRASPQGVITWVGQAASGYVVGEVSDRVAAMDLVEAHEHTGHRPLVFKVRTVAGGAGDQVELDIEGLMRLSTPAAPPQQLVAAAWQNIAMFLGLDPERVVVELLLPDEEDDPECE